MARTKIKIPVLTVQDIANFPSPTASAREVKEWLITMCTNAILKGGHLRLDSTKLTGAYLHSAKASALMTVLRGIGFTDARLRKGRWIVGYILAARRLKVKKENAEVVEDLVEQEDMSLSESASNPFLTETLIQQLNQRPRRSGSTSLEAQPFIRPMVPSPGAAEDASVVEEEICVRNRS